MESAPVRQSSQRLAGLAVRKVVNDSVLSHRLVPKSEVTTVAGC